MRTTRRGGGWIVKQVGLSTYHQCRRFGRKTCLQRKYNSGEVSGSRPSDRSKSEAVVQVVKWLNCRRWGHMRVGGLEIVGIFKGAGGKSDLC